MTIAPAILENYPHLSDPQRAIVGHGDGPLLVIAGPGSGKTYSIVLRALNLLLLGKAEMPQVGDLVERKVRIIASIRNLRDWNELH